MPVKQKTKRSKLPTAALPSGSKAQRMVDRLRQQYALGRDAVEAQKNGTSTEEFGAVHNYSGHMMRKMKAFARHYSLEELDALCDGLRPNGLPLHWGYIPVLLAVEGKHGKADREELQRLAIVEGWTVPKLRREVRKRFSVDGHGRNPQFSGSATDEFNTLIEGLEFIERRCRRLLDSGTLKRNKAIQTKCGRLWRALVAVRKKAG